MTAIRPERLLAASAAAPSEVTGEEALRQASELSYRARREARNARALARTLSAQPTAAISPGDTERPPVTSLTIGCRTCSVSLHPDQRDLDEAARVAREFFLRHETCLTYVELEPIRRTLG